MSIRSFLINIDNKLARQWVSIEFTGKENTLEELDIAILYIVNELENKYAKKHNQWTIPSIQKQLGEFEVKYSNAKLYQRIKVLEANELIQTGRWMEVIKNKNRDEGGNTIFLISTQKGIKSLNEIKFLTRFALKGLKQYKKTEGETKVNSIKKTTILGIIMFAGILLLFTGMANATCPDPCRLYSGDPQATMTLDPTGVYCLCDAAHYLACLNDQNTDGLDQCNQDLNILINDYNALEEQYNFLASDKNGISQAYYQTLDKWGNDLNRISKLQETISGKDTNIAELQTEKIELEGQIAQLTQDNNICEYVKDFIGATTRLSGETKEGIDALIEDESTSDFETRQAISQNTAGLTTLSTKTDMQTAILATICIASAIAIFLLPKIKLPRKKRPVPVEERKDEAGNPNAVSQ